MHSIVGLEKRKVVLSMSLMLEDFTATFLAGLLGIVNSKDTISFGNKSTSLSFNQKVGLLIDIGALSKDKQEKFITFMGIRNQFMHNMQATSYEKCIGFLDGKEKYLFKLFPPDISKNKEEQLARATELLWIELMAICGDLYEKMKKKIERDVMLSMFAEAHPLLLKLLKEAEKKRKGSDKPDKS